jgi:hypothetical protein
MSGNLPWYVVLFIALAGMVIPLISRIVENRHQKRLKMLEVMLNRKLDSYSDYIKSTAEFGYMAPKDSSEYNEYLKAYYMARLVATPEVKDAMGKVAFEANKLRAAGGFGAVSGLEKSWQDAVDKTSEEMAKEIEKLTYQKA